MLLFHEYRMGQPVAGVCRAPHWGPPSARWFAPPGPVMTEVYDDVHSLPPSSPQSDSDSSLSDYRTPASFYQYKPAFSSDSPTTHPSPLSCHWTGCQEVFSSLDCLSNHVAANHADISGGLFYCGWEGCSRGHRGFNARYKMLVHVRTHTNEKPHKCSQCEKSFSRAENLKIHTRSHSGEKPYVCPVEGCNKAYSNSSDRFKHTRTHSVDKPYCCKVVGCQKRYTDPSSLRKHVKTYKHASMSPIQPEADLHTEHYRESPALRVPRDVTSHYTRFTEQNHYKTSTVNMLDDDRFDRNIKLVQRKYSYSESDRPLPENLYKINMRSQTPPIINSSIDRNTYCFCRDSPCHHTKYVNPEYLKMESSPHSQSPKPEQTDFAHIIQESSHIIDERFISEPLNLKRHRHLCEDDEIYENGVLNLEKKVKTELRGTEVSFNQDICDTPLDLSVHKTLL